jgi:arabinose-5-phosphate isomerase
MDDRIRQAKAILEHEAEAVRQVIDHLGPDFVATVELVLGLPGRVVTTGMGKAGIIARKLSATLASTGTPSIFLHPAEAIHGDLGRVCEGDMLLALSKSGETEEVLHLLGPVEAVGVPVVALTSSRDSNLGRHARYVLEIGAIEEAGQLALAPSASTTAMLALGDALALVVQDARDFGPEDFARFHPGGSLGRRLMKVDELMRTADRNPRVRTGTTVLDAIGVMTRTPGRPGATSVVDEGDRLVGFFTDGDLRRLLESKRHPHLDAVPVDDVMTRNPRSGDPDMYAMEALASMHRLQIDQLPIVDTEGRLVGLLDVQDLIDLKMG